MEFIGYDRFILRIGSHDNETEKVCKACVFRPPFKPTDLQTRGADGVDFSLRARKTKQNKQKKGNS